MVITLLLTMLFMVNQTTASGIDMPFLTGIKNTDDFTKQQEKHLTQAKAALDQLLAVKEKRSIENTLALYDEILIHLDAVSNQTSLLQNVHPDGTMRTAAEQFSQKASAFASELSLNRAVYDALSATDCSKADAKTKFYVEKTLLNFRLSGVDKDDTTRAKIKALREELVIIGQDFARNIREDVRTVRITDVKELDGLPQDYIDRHKPDSSSVITLTINYPDAIPVFTYAKSENVRKRMYMEYNNRAYPKNINVLNTMIAKRYELAKLLGFANWASYITSNDRSLREYQMLLDRKKQDVPNATTVNAWESGYYSELVRKAKFDFDGQKVRPYLSYDLVKQGVLDVYSKLFSVEFRLNTTAPVWDPSVDCYDMYDGGTLAGRFYLDMHPRKDKFNHAAEFGVRNGAANKQIPEAALICNFPGGEKGDPGLMEDSDVETFFHEFGHLLHHLFAGRQQWIGVAGISTEWDFVEAPSQLLEEWSWDAKTLQTFAKQYKTNEPIPAELVAQMRRASEFGKGLQVRTQMYYAKLSLSCYDRDPKQVNTDEFVKTLRERYTPYKYVEGTHMQTAFGHLDEYSAIYYTYMWSLVIAKDLFTAFNKENLLDPVIAKKYRDAVLVPGGSLPAAQLVKNFLGRDFSFDGWKKWIEKE
jgi:thimet oligopeptidase